MLADLCEKCKDSLQLRADLELILNSFQGAITESYKRRDTPPHCIFAFDKLVDQALDHIVAVLSPGECVCVCLHACVYVWVWVGVSVLVIWNATGLCFLSSILSPTFGVIISSF